MRPPAPAIGDNRPVASGRVLVVGSVNVDLVVAAPRLPGPGQTVTGGDLARYQGGKGGNQATAAARLGARVAFVGSVGDDEMGRQARSALASEGIEVTSLAVSGRATGVALIVVDPRGENLITVAPGANEDVHAAQVRTALAALAPGTHDVVLVCREIPADGVRAALEVGREAGSITILNPAPADGLDAATLALADILTPNQTELALLVGLGPADGDPETAARHVLAGPPTGAGRRADDGGHRARRRVPELAGAVARTGAVAGIGADAGTGAIAGTGAVARTGADAGTRADAGTGAVAGIGADAGRSGDAHDRAVVVTLGAAGALIVCATGAADRCPCPRGRRGRHHRSGRHVQWRARCGAGRWA